MKSLKYFVLALALGCGGSGSSGNHRDSSRPCPDMGSMYDQSSERNKGRDVNNTINNDMNNSREDVYSDGFDSGCPDLGLEGRLDAGADVERDVGADAGRCSPREITYPYADLVCEEPDCRVNEDCLYEFSLRRDRTFCWDASPSMAGSGRSLERYSFHWFGGKLLILTQTVIDGRACFEYGFVGSHSGRLEVFDNLGDIGTRDFINIVRD